MKLKHLAAAAALLAAGSAFAEINAANDPKVVGVVWDEEKATYAIDFNLTVSQLLGLANGAVLGSTAGSADWASFVAADGNTADYAGLAGTRFALFAVDATGQTVFDVNGDYKYFTTFGGNTTPLSVDGLSLSAVIDTVAGDTLSRLNNNGFAAGNVASDLFAANGTDADYNEGLLGGPFGMFAGNAIGGTSKLFVGTTQIATTGDVFSPAVWAELPVQVAFDGTNFTAVTAVPEPGTYALLLAGLCAVGFMVRRRQF